MLGYRGARVLIAALVALTVGPTVARASTLPVGFQEAVVFSGLNHPTVVRFSPDGRVFVAQKNGQIVVYDSLTDTSPTLFADLSAKVHDFWDRGMLGMALDPNFPATPDVYVLYTYDAAIGGIPPTWGDGCPTPPGPTTDGCLVSARLSRLTASGNVMTGSEQVLINDWCQQFPSHSVGSLEFGRDGALYVTAGDGASFNYVDYGQTKNPCGDPPGAAGTNLTAPTAEGGALRSQDVRTSGDPATLDGAVLRIDKATGQGMPDNPFAASPDANTRRVIAYGLRNPFRATIRPGTDELWVGDVGWNTWEEINRVANPAGAATNFGWPCYEGNLVQSGYDAANVNLCESLYAAGSSAVTAPRLAYNHSAAVASGDGCPTANGSAVAGLAFASPTSSYPAAYTGALFFADHNRNCIWTMFADGTGLPSASSVQLLMSGGSGPVDLEIGPGGDLFYAGYDGGDVRRISYPVANRVPTAVAKATPTAGSAPLTVAFDATGSSDPDPGDTLTYAWDLDGDGAYDDSTAARPSWTYTQDGTVTARLRVTDPKNASATDAVVISVGNTKPTATITAPSAGTSWRVGQVITFSGTAADPQQGTLPASALTWTLTLWHCPAGCHAHQLQTFGGTSGSFTAPDHEYPSYLELKLTATDAGGLQDTQVLRLDPRTVQLTMSSNPGGLTLSLNSISAPTSFTRTVIEGSANSIGAPDQVRNKSNWVFQSWSDGGPATHNIVANTSITYNATFRKQR